MVYVRPVLEYASVIWSPSTISLQQDIERVQRRFTKRLHGMRPLPYEERLAHLHLESLTERRCRADLLTVTRCCITRSMSGRITLVFNCQQRLLAPAELTFPTKMFSFAERSANRSWFGLVLVIKVTLENEYLWTSLDAN